MAAPAAAAAVPAAAQAAAPFLDARMQLFDMLKAEDDARRAALAAAGTKITVTLPDGATREAVAHVTTPLDIATGISAGLANNVVVARVNGVLWDLTRELEESCTLELIKWDDPVARHVFWHSSAHILGEALELVHGAHLCKGPAIDDGLGGFFYDSELPGGRVVTQSDFDGIKAAVDRIVKQKQPFERVRVTKEQLLELFAYNKFKVEILNMKLKAGEVTTAYRCGTLIDLCKGPHLPNTGRVKAFTLTKNSSAHWLSDPKREALQRVYGISFPDPKQLKEFITFQEEAAKRDHRLIGTRQELFMFSDLTPGSPFFLPHGTRIYNKLMEFMREQYNARGFNEVVTPTVYSSKLWMTSGHWDKYRENMFLIEKFDDGVAGLKAMNCPAHCLIFKLRTRSHRELPLRLADFGALHRNEDRGALTGLLRVRRFQQDDAHIFCANEHIPGEIAGAFDFLQFTYDLFGFELEYELSTRPKEFLGELAVWDAAEAALKAALDASGRVWKLNPGDGAFYGPKIDIHVRDALKRSHQLATIQLDFQLPKRFELEFQAADGTLTQPVIIHRAIFGSLERFMAILIEQFAGKWPFWLSPRQVMVVPVGKQFFDYAQSVRDRVHAAGFYADVDNGPNKFEKKIREAQLAQYNFMLVVGAKEEANKTVNVRSRNNDVLGEQSIDDALARFAGLARTRSRDA